MVLLIIGNIIALVASLIMLYCKKIKRKNKILYFQTIQIFLFAISNLILDGITGAIINFLQIIRNILYLKDKYGIKEKLIITLLSIILTFIFNNLGLIGLLPLLSALIYIWLINSKDEKMYKLLLGLTMLMWFIYDITIKSYTSSIFEFFSILGNLITIF